MERREWVGLLGLVIITLMVIALDPFGRYRMHQLEVEYERRGPGLRGPIIAVLPHRQQPLYLDFDDPISSIDACRDYAHFYGGHLCLVKPASLGTGRWRNLDRRWKDVLIGLQMETP